MSCAVRHRPHCTNGTMIGARRSCSDCLRLGRSLAGSAALKAQECANSLELLQGLRGLTADLFDASSHFCQTFDHDFDGETRLEGFLRTHSELPQADLIRQLTVDILAFCGDACPTDDMTLMSIRRTEMSDR